MAELHGVDVASYQGPPGTWMHAAGRIRWAAIKLTELQPDGTRYVNPDAASDWQWLRQAGHARIAYLFGHPGTDAAAAAQFFVDELRALGLDDTDGVALDLEVTDGKTPAEVTAWASKVLSEIEARVHRLPLVYTYLAFAEAGNCSTLGDYPLWIADPSSPAGSPRVPAPWKTWAIHQYSQAGTIDRDVAAWTSVP